MNLVELKKYPFEEAIYIQVFEIPEKELESRPLNELITDYAHLRENVEEAIQILSEREQVILRQVLDQKMTLRAVSNECGITSTRTGQILFKALRRLQYFPGRHILDGTRRQNRIEANTEKKRAAALEEEWTQINTEVERQKNERWAQIGARLSLKVGWLSLTPICERKLNALGVETIGELLERYPYDSRTNGLTGLAVADGIDESDYREIWSALFMAGALIRIPEPPDFEALKRAEQTMSNGEASRVIEMPTEELELPIRAYNCLMRGRIRSVGELLDRLDLDIDAFLALDRQKVIRMIAKLKIRNLGWKCAEEIVDRLHEMFDGSI